VSALNQRDARWTRQQFTLGFGTADERNQPTPVETKGDRAGTLRLATAVALATTALSGDDRYLDISLLNPQESKAA
jgi:hypothetical protein